MRVFAGPNGSGKSTIINEIRKQKIKGHLIDFGTYINADEIERDLRAGKIDLGKYQVIITEPEFTEIARKSGLLESDRFNFSDFVEAFSLKSNMLLVRKEVVIDRIAQITAHVLRKKLLAEQKKFSFETVFSHPSKVEIMQEAVDAGYKVYLYFVGTKSPEINQFRVKVRVLQGGHPVPINKISDRYYRSMELLHTASQLAYQAFFFDNSDDGEGKQSMFAHFKVDSKGVKIWDDFDSSSIPQWFIKYYANKTSQS